MVVFLLVTIVSIIEMIIFAMCFSIVLDLRLTRLEYGGTPFLFLSLTGLYFHHKFHLSSCFFITH